MYLRKKKKDKKEKEKKRTSNADSLLQNVVFCSRSF